MKLSERISRISVSGLCLICLALPLGLGGCNAVPARVEPREETSILPDTPLPAEEKEITGENPQDYAKSRPRSKVRDELIVAFSKGEVELDFRKSFLATEAQLFTAIYEGLFSYHPFSMEPVPAAARKWETSEDKKQWTFTIRDSAKFQNGDPLRAEHFRTAWLSLLDPEKDSPYSSLFDIIEGARD